MWKYYSSSLRPSDSPAIILTPTIIVPLSGRTGPAAQEVTAETLSTGTGSASKGSESCRQVGLTRNHHIRQATRFLLPPDGVGLARPDWPWGWGTSLHRRAPRFVCLPAVERDLRTSWLPPALTLKEGPVMKRGLCSIPEAAYFWVSDTAPLSKRNYLCLCVCSHKKHGRGRMCLLKTSAQRRWVCLFETCRFGQLRQTQPDCGIVCI